MSPHRLPIFAALSFAFLAFSVARPAQGAAEAARPTAAEVRSAIERYVEHDVALKKAFLLVDPRTVEPLRLTFDHVHEGVESKGQQSVACVDFRDAKGKVYDVDIAVDPSREVTSVTLHKVDGQALPQPGHP